ncbi:hypothetical protein CRENBAI_016830 [Crenichthys baileyi]|uniref:Uncharacterized protein n=1 Tax=Crenichthys baileyi TaxID=28760 RepID=A0AAV9REZ0_9TELE
MKASPVVLVSGRGRSRPSVKTQTRTASVTLHHLSAERHLRLIPDQRAIIDYLRTDRTMPSMRHSYTVTVPVPGHLAALPLDEPELRRKQLSRSMLVSTFMGLIINPAKEGELLIRNMSLEEYLIVHAAGQLLGPGSAHSQHIFVYMWV